MFPRPKHVQRNLERKAIQSREKLKQEMLKFENIKSELQQVAEGKITELRQTLARLSATQERIGEITAAYSVPNEILKKGASIEDILNCFCGKQSAPYGLAGKDQARFQALISQQRELVTVAKRQAEEVKGLQDKIKGLDWQSMSNQVTPSVSSAPFILCRPETLTAGVKEGDVAELGLEIRVEDGVTKHSEIPPIQFSDLLRSWSRKVPPRKPVGSSPEVHKDVVVTESPVESTAKCSEPAAPDDGPLSLRFDALVVLLIASVLLGLYDFVAAALRKTMAISSGDQGICERSEPIQDHITAENGAAVCEAAKQ